VKIRNSTRCCKLKPHPSHLTPTLSLRRGRNEEREKEENVLNNTFCHWLLFPSFGGVRGDWEGVQSRE